MCRDCFQENIYQFISQQEFSRLEVAIWDKIRQDRLRELKPDAEADNYQPDTLYQCQTCRETWALAAPDNAWRGYFLNLASAAAYRSKLRRNDRIKGVIGIACLLAFGASILWAMLR
ncbi:hypothetical protein GCM10027345_25980 [Hymenobacter daeguensis]